MLAAARQMEAWIHVDLLPHLHLSGEGSYFLITPHNAPTQMMRKQGTAERVVSTTHLSDSVAAVHLGPEGHTEARKPAACALTHMGVGSMSGGGQSCSDACRIGVGSVSDRCQIGVRSAADLFVSMARDAETQRPQRLWHGRLPFATPGLMHHTHQHAT